MPDSPIPLVAKVKYASIGALVFGALPIFCMTFVPAISEELVASACGSGGCENESAFNIAVQLGRLDVVSIVMGMLGIGVGAFAIFGFFAIRDHAEAVSQTVARNVATEVAAQVAAQKLEWVTPPTAGPESKEGKTSLDPATEALTKSSEKAEDDDDEST